MSREPALQPPHTCAVIQQATLDPAASTDFARNRSAQDAATVALRIVRHGNDAGFFLLRLDAAGEALADTFHESVEAACAQAAFEFQIKPEDWREAGAV